MTRLLMLSAAIFALSAAPALADHHEEKGDHKGKMWEKIDTDGDGVISKDEFMTKTEKKFTDIDANGDGNLTQDEMNAHHEEMREKFKERRDEMRAKKKEHMEEHHGEMKADDEDAPSEEE